MAEKRIIAVVGATGAQGGGLVRAILSDKGGPFAARAITRDINSDKAKELAQLGAEVVAGDVDDVESLKKAFKGAYGAYCVTFFWAHFSPEKEKANARAMAEAAKHAGIQHAIWSTFEDTRKSVPLSDSRMPTLMGSYKVPHFDAKAEANHFFTDLGVRTTFLLTSFYWENLIYFGMGPKRGPDGKLAITLPMGDKKLASIASEDIGKCAYGIFKAGREFIGTNVGGAGTGAEERRHCRASPGRVPSLSWQSQSRFEDVKRPRGVPSAGLRGPPRVALRSARALRRRRSLSRRRGTGRPSGRRPRSRGWRGVRG